MTLIGIIVLLIILVNITPVQNFLAQQAVNYLSDKLQTKVTLKHVRIDLLNAATLEGLYIEDRQKDTLLYAGEAKIKITDWFFLKKKPVISYVGLKNAYVNLYRRKNSDQWNYQFVIDAFASKSSKPKKESKLDIDLRDVELQNVRFHMIDAWTGSDMIGELTTFDIHARKIDFDKKIIDVRSISGDKVLFGLRDYKGGKPPSMITTATPEIVDTTPFNPALWKISLNKLNLQNSRFFLEDPDTKPLPGYFDAANMDVTGINLDAQNIIIRGDTLTGDLRMFKAKERCGLEIKKMTAKVTVSPNISECKDLVLQTGNSLLTNYYAMKYDRFPDFTEYITNVIMVARLQQSEVGIQDIVYFAPDLERFKHLSVKVSGNSNGTVEKLRVNDLVLNDGFSQVKGDLYMNGLPEIESTFIDFKNADIHTNGAGIFVYAPELKRENAVNLAALSNIDFKGSFTGFINDFVAYGSLVSNLGNAQADINLKLPAKKQPSYSGSLTANNFDIGRLLNQSALGRTTFNTSVKGSGFDATTMSATITGDIQAFELNGYNYRNIKVDGVFASKRFDGKLSAKDPNISMDFNGKIDFSQKEPAFDVYAKIEHLNAYALKFTNDSIVASGEMALNFSGSNIDNFIGSANIYNIDILRDSARLNIDSLLLVSRIDSGNAKQLTLTTNGIQAVVTGHFSIMDLPNSAKMFLSHYLPHYVSAPARVNENQDLKFELTTGNTGDILSLFNRNIQVGEGTHLTGAMDMPNQQFSFNGTVPYFNYGNLRINSIQVNSKGNYSGLSLEATANGIKAGGNDLVSSLQFQTNIFQDSAKFQLLTTTPTSIGSAELNGVAYAARDSFHLHILPSQFYINQYRWEIPKDNEIVFAKNFLALKNVRLQSGVQKVLINTNGNERPNEAIVNIENLDIAPIVSIFSTDMNLDGRVNGKLEVSPLLKDQMIDFDIAADGLRMGTDTLGEANLVGSYDVAQSLVTLKDESGLKYKDSRAMLTGTYSLDPKSNENINAKISLDHANTNWAQPFLIGYVHNLSGSISGDINIKGNASNPITSGSIKLTDVGFTPDITGAHYTIKDATINVSDTKFDLGSINIVDDEGREGRLIGSVTHSRLSKMTFRLTLRSDNIKVIDLKDYENPNFYGDVNASVQLRLSGPINNLNLNIFATPQKNSHLFIPIGYGSDVSEYSYIRFKQYGEVQEVKPVSKNKLNIRIDAIATPDLEATIVLDQATGDQIWAKGSGNLILEIPADGEMRMNGNYIIDEGKYNFSFRQLQVLNYKRQFTINSNSVIKWNGDVADADLDVTAYAQIKARLYDLIINEVDRVGLSASEVRDAQIMQMVNVLMNMKGSLKQPEFSFKLELAENRSVGTYAYQKLQRINSDDKELLNQVASLLLLEQFVPPEGISNSNAVASGTINNMSELISSAASSQITNFANKLLGMEDLYIGLKYKNYNLADNSQLGGGINYLNRNEAGINLRKNFLKNRLIVEVGGVYDWGRSGTQSASFTNNFAGDFRVQYLLTEDGRIRFNVFRTSNYDALFSQVIGRQGVGLSYRKSFNGLWDLFRSEQKMRREREEQLKKQQQTQTQGMKPEEKPEPKTDSVKMLLSNK